MPAPDTTGRVERPASPSQFANIVAYHLLISLVNLLNLPLPKGTFIPRRGWQLHVMNADVERLRMLKRELDTSDPGAVRGFLVGAKATLFELEVCLHQWPDLQRNPKFEADFARLSNLVAQANALDDAEEARDLAYKLSVMLPFYEDEAAMLARNKTADEWFATQQR
ncbi:MAG: hypothetical protein WDA16_01110 [Candidatus Thermoplasmatota archaeon]